MKNSNDKMKYSYSNVFKIFVFICGFLSLNFSGFAQNSKINKKIDNKINSKPKSYNNHNNYYNYSEAKTSNYAKSADYELAKRYLKLGNSYREAQKLELAFHYINLGMQTFIRQRNFDESYWYAVSQEYLAYCYKNIGDFSKARYFLEQSLQTYQKIINMDFGSQYAARENILKLENELLTVTNFDAEKSILPTVNPNFETTVEQNEPQIETYVLNLDNRKLSTFPDDITRKRIDNISIVKNKFTNFPDEIYKYSTLKTLNVAFNKIKNFPDLSKLQNLEFVNFSDNKITEIDGNIGKLRNLKYLNLSNNKQLKNISLEIGKLKNCLKELNIWNTKIDESLIRQLTRELPNTNIISGSDKKKNNYYNNFDFTGEDEFSGF